VFEQICHPERREGFRARRHCVSSTEGAVDMPAAAAVVS